MTLGPRGPPTALRGGPFEKRPDESHHHLATIFVHHA